MINDRTRRPDIAFFISSMGDGGAQRTIANLASGLSRRGYEVDLTLIRAEGPYLEDLDSDINIIDLNSNRAITSVLPLTMYLRRTRPHVLFSTLNYLNIVAILAGLVSGTSIDVVIRSANIQSTHSHQKQDQVLPELMRIFYRFSDKHVALSQAVAEDVCANYGLDRDETTVIYNPTVTEDLFDKATEPIDHQWFDSDVSVIIGVGRLSEQKNFEILIRAFEQVIADRNVRLVILGKGEKRSELEMLVEELGLADVVSMPGFVDNPYAYMHRADLFILSSRWEGFGNVIVEAMACGTPVVSTDCPGGPSEILNNGTYGPLVPVGDPNRLAERILEALDSPVDASTLKTRAMEFSVETITDEYERFLFNMEVS